MTSNLPSGTVTFLFSDIEGSTKLAQRYPDLLPSLLSRHHEILHQAIKDHNGFVFQIVGDSFSAAFQTASDALDAALESQRTLHKEAWDPEPIKVRMGINTGAAQWKEDSTDTPYEGYATLALTQRIMSAGHGGQILLSQTTHDLLQHKLLAQAQFLDMGERRLKDVLRPEHLYQVTVPDLPSEFAPLNTLELFKHNLPVQFTSFIGREKEINEIKNLLATYRMVTLTGSGGAGKTRLSLHVGTECLNQFLGGVWFAELAPVSDPALVSQTLLSIFKLRDDPHRAPLEVLLDYLREKTILLILDNCEHIIEVCAEISETLLRACPQLKILASSREVLGMAGEVPYRVPSLATPNPAQLPPLENLLDIDSIRLFIDRATIVKPDFKLTKDHASFVTQICSRLDGIPLAIELAAARMRILSPEQIAARLDDRFRLLTGGSRTALPRQQTLRALIDWSYSLLSEQEKILFCRLAVFVGGWTLEAAESVCGEVLDGVNVLDLLTKLVDKSLVFSEEAQGKIRFHRLETIRQYSRERFFETDEVETIRDRHLAFYVKYAETAEEHMRGRARVAWTHRLEAEQENFRTAMEWGLARNPESALRIASSLPIFWTAGGFSAEGFRWIQQATIAYREQIDEQTQRNLHAKALTGLAFLYVSFGDNVNGKRVAEESVALFRQSQDKSGLAYALVILANPLEFLGERLQAEAALMESVAIARSEKHTFVLASAMSGLTRLTLHLHNDADAAERYADEAIRVSQEAGIEWTGAAAYEMKGIIAYHRKNYDEARILFEKAFHAYQEIGARFNVILAKSTLAHMERELGNHTIALNIYRETILAFRDVAQTGAVAHQLECFGFIALAQNHSEHALQLFAAANALREKAGTPMTLDEQVYFDEQLGMLREKMSDAEFKKAWEDGSMMTMEQAITFALEAESIERG
jgi:predicted ATPase/class 3 adenylate cyclase